MGIFDELNKTLKQSQNELKEADPDRQLRGLNQEPGRSGRELSSEAGKGSDSMAQPAPRTGHITPQLADSARNSHKGYSNLIAWIKTKYGSRYRTILDSYQQKLVLEQVTTDACCDLPEKTKKRISCLSEKPEL